MTGPGATQVTLFRTSSGHQASLTTVGVCSGTENCGALVSAGGEQAKYKMVDINCELDTVHCAYDTCSQLPDILSMSIQTILAAFISSNQLYFIRIKYTGIIHCSFCYADVKFYPIFG